MKRGTVIKNSSYFDFKAKSNCYQIKIRELKALPRDLGKKIDLSGRLEWKAEDLPEFLKSDEENEKFYEQIKKQSNKSNNASDNGSRASGINLDGLARKLGTQDGVNFLV